VVDISIRRKQGNFIVNASFNLQGGGITVLYGSSGAGKTSIINMVAGLLQPDEGRIAINGHVLFDSTKGINVPPEKRKIGYVFQDGRLFPHLSVRSNLSYGMYRRSSDDRFVDFDQVVRLLGIRHLLDRCPAKLSGGEKQRVAIGRALLTSPSILLMDEPLASLDRARKVELLPFIDRLSQEFSIPILYVSHSMDEIINLADSIVILHSGCAVAAGKLDELMSRGDWENLSGQENFGAVISTVVEGHDEEFGLTELGFPGGVLKVPRFEISCGSNVRVNIHPRDVAIALNPPSQISIQNIFHGTVEEIIKNNGVLVDVRLNIGCPLLARITLRAREDLDLSLGQRVFALVKSVAISRGILNG